MKAEEAREIAKWIAGKSAEIAYGEIVVKVVKHNGQVFSVEKMTTEKTRPEK